MLICIINIFYTKDIFIYLLIYNQENNNIKNINFISMHIIIIINLFLMIIKRY